MDREVQIEILVYLIIIVFCLVCTILAYYIFFQKELICVGNLQNGQCASVQPYFCSEGRIVKDISKCGCPVNSMIIEGDCVSEYETGPQDISLRYILRGKRGSVNFTIYQGVYDQILQIPRYIESSENPTLLDFRLKNVDNPFQREFLYPLVVEIQNITDDREDQVRIAISLVQNILYGYSTKSLSSYSRLTGVGYQRYAYEVIYEDRGVCGEKTGLLVFLLKELGYGTAFVYYKPENHEAAGIKCPAKNSIFGTDYCFVETTGPSIISDDKTEFVGIEQLSSTPEMIVISDGKSFGKSKYEYRDADTLEKIRNSMKEYEAINFMQVLQFRSIKKKYGLMSFDSYTFT
jgi:hypothetical protein